MDKESFFVHCMIKKQSLYIQIGAIGFSAAHEKAEFMEE